MKLCTVCLSCPASLACLTGTAFLGEAYQHRYTIVFALRNSKTFAIQNGKTLKDDDHVLISFTGGEASYCPLVVEFRLNQAGIVDAKSLARSIAGPAGFARFER